MNGNSSKGPAMQGQDAEYERLVARFSQPQALDSALERVKAEARRRARARELVTRARGGRLHNHTVREIARYFRTGERGRVDLLEVADQTGIPLSDARQVLREFVDAGLLQERKEMVNDLVRRSYELTDGAHGGITEIFVETEATAQQHTEQEGAGWVSGRLGWGRTP
ncbi:hypothetical protein [Streptomyces cyaneofuscatus]|uniref:hypothetical protein n=1 Tax=Streptomyces cyaneofuscatus TaxID=66883 RepID=UPI0034256B1E